MMHDYDNNSKLDGLEIFQGLSHHEHSDGEGEYPQVRWLMYKCTFASSFKIPFSYCNPGNITRVCYFLYVFYSLVALNKKEIFMA